MMKALYKISLLLLLGLLLFAGCKKDDPPAMVEIPDDAFLGEVCVWTMPFPPEGVTVDTTECSK